MRLLLDQGLPRSTATMLRASGWDVIHTAEQDMSRAPDIAVLAFARAQRRTVCTLDADFHAILAVSGERAPSAIRVRRESLRGPELANLLLALPPSAIAALESGALITITDAAIRIRRLPVVRKG